MVTLIERHFENSGAGVIFTRNALMQHVEDSIFPAFDYFFSSYHDTLLCLHR